MKCAYSHCKHGGEVDKDEAVKVSTRYYHPDCLAEKNAMLEIVDVWTKRIDKFPIFSLLRKIVNDLVYKEGNDAEYLLFALNYCLDHGWNLTRPQGLRFVAKDQDARKAWDSRKEQEALQKLNEELKKESASDDWSLPEIKINQKSNRTKVSSVLGV